MFGFQNKLCVECKICYICHTSCDVSSGTQNKLRVVCEILCVSRKMHYLWYTKFVTYDVQNTLHVEHKMCYT